MNEEIQQQINRLNQQVRQLYQEGRYEQGVEIAIQARDLARQHLGEHYERTASNIATMFSGGRFTK